MISFFKNKEKDNEYDKSYSNIAALINSCSKN